MKALEERLGIIGAERFIVAISRDKYDYTEWRRTMFEGMSLRELSKAASDYCNGTGDDKKDKVI